MKIGRNAGNPGLARLWVLAAAALGAAILVSRGAAAFSEQVLYSFCAQANCADGAFPRAGLIMDGAGNLYGTAGGGTFGQGVVFKLAPDGTETVLYSFCPQGGFCADGAEPDFAGLVMDEAGNLYGTTFVGSASFRGVVFELAPDGTETVLHSFGGGRDGAFPFAGLIMDAAGNLYGTTRIGGLAGLNGVVFKLGPDGTETVLHTFCGQADLPNCADGADPKAGLIVDGAGNLYGTTSFGGGSNGNGVVFELDRDGTETVLYIFCQQSGCADGALPVADLLRDAAGNLYGTTSSGGAGNGVVFKLAPDGTETVLYSFGGPDGASPQAGLIMDAAGNLYGTTSGGGASNSGVVFELAPDGTETVLYSFSGGADGANPLKGRLIRDAAGNLYGTTRSGGASNSGVVFKLTP